MDLYTETSYRLAKQLTESYSTSFSMSSLLFSDTVRPHIYAIYGLVRIADEIVDTYLGNDALTQLDELEAQTAAALVSGYSSNPLVHAFVTTARHYGITRSLTAPFFTSMRRDLEPVQQFTQKEYDDYIYGSASVVGLMCLKIFVDGNETQYEALRLGASALGSAYQKVNFLRDIGADALQRGRWYFPTSSLDSFDEAAKTRIIDDIRQDFSSAKNAVAQLPNSARAAVATSYAYYYRLLEIIEKTPAEVLKHTRIRVPNTTKALLLLKARLLGGRI